MANLDSLGAQATETKTPNVLADNQSSADELARATMELSFTRRTQGGTVFMDIYNAVGDKVYTDKTAKLQNGTIKITAVDDGNEGLVSEDQNLIHYNVNPTDFGAGSKIILTMNGQLDLTEIVNKLPGAPFRPNNFISFINGKGSYTLEFPFTVNA
ncbi:MAG: hypothetical protein R3213_13495 [Flavobacteriaceae bacterium]|nr:hypothetical protein [Flavobacteriaceae bacterium]